MAKILLFLSFSVMLMLILVTAFAPNNSILYLAGSSNNLQYIREFLASVLLLQLVTRPPRHLIFRLLSGFIALSVGVWVIDSTYAGSMLFLDSLSLLAAATSIGVAALEFSTSRLNKPTIKEYHSGNPLLA